MSRLLALKNRKKVVNTIFRACSAMKAAASVRVHKIEKSIEDFKVSYDMIMRHSGPILEQFFLSTIMNSNSKARGHIIVGCDTGMCGDFMSMIKLYFKHQIELQENDLAAIQAGIDNYWMIFGAKLENFFPPSKLNIKYFGKIGLTDSNVFYKMWDFIEEKQISELIIHHFDKKEIVKSTVFSKEKMLEAFVANDDPMTELVKSRTVENSKLDPNLLTQEYAMFFLAANLYRAFLASLYEENRQRIYAMSQAKTNAENMGKIIDRLYNRARQEKITMELNEITAGII